MAPTSEVAPSGGREVREASLLDYVRAIWRHKLIVVLTLVVALGAVLGLDSRRHKVYEGTAQLLFTAQGVTGTTASLSTDALATDLELVESAPVQALVAKDLHAPAPAVSVGEIGATDVAAITVDAASPAFAARAANAYARAYITSTTTGFVRSQLATERQIQGQISKLQGEITAVSQQLGTTTGSTRGRSSTGQSQARLANLYTQLGSLQVQLGQIQLATSQSSSAGQIVAPAIPNPVPISPKRTRDALIAGGVGLLVGIAFALMRDFTDDHVRSPDALEEAAGGTPVVGLIPAVKGWRDEKKAMLVTASARRSAAAEAYRGLRTSVQFMSLDDPLRTLQVTSPGAGDGKTSTATNLALTMAEAGKRVALLDCDLRRPRVHAFFDLGNAVGLTSVLLGDREPEDAIVPAPGRDHLLVLPAGPIPPNPAELLAGPRVPKLFDALLQMVEVVVIDSAPVLTVTDASAIAAQVDGVLLVAMAGISTKKDVGRAMENLSRVGARLIGTVLNRAPESGPYAYARYGYVYGYDNRPSHARQA